MPDRLDDAQYRGPLVEIALDRAVFRLPSVGSFLVHVDGHVEVQPAAESSAPDLRCAVRGPVLALAMLLQGRFCLRGAAVLSADGGGAVLLCGPSGCGASTTAAALAGSGWAVAADPVLVVTDDAGLRVANLGGGVELWPDAVAGLGVQGGGSIVREGLAKRRFATAAAPDAEDAAISQVVVLAEDTRLSPPDVLAVRQDLGAGDAMRRLVEAQWLAQAIPALGLAARHFEWLSALLSVGPSAVRRAPTHLPETAQLVAELVRR